MTQGQGLVLARCVGFAFRAPGFAHPSVPAPVRAAFACALALAIGSANGRVALDPAAFALALMTELLLGAAIGAAAAALYDGAYAGGRTVDDYVGIRASVPTAGIVAGAGFGRLWSLGFAACFFVLGGHRALLLELADGFARVPPGGLVLSHAWTSYVVAIPATLLRAAICIGGPAIVAALIVQVMLAATTRIVPRLSTFTLSFPLVFATAVVATIVALPLVLPLAAHPWIAAIPIGGP